MRIKVLETMITTLEARLDLPGTIGPHGQQPRAGDEMMGAVNA